LLFGALKFRRASYTQSDKGNRYTLFMWTVCKKRRTSTFSRLGAMACCRCMEISPIVLNGKRRSGAIVVPMSAETPSNCYMFGNIFEE
jgi:hypothetical protein